MIKKNSTCVFGKVTEFHVVKRLSLRREVQWSPEQGLFALNTVRLS